MNGGCACTSLITCPKHYKEIDDLLDNISSFAAYPHTAGEMRNDLVDRWTEPRIIKIEKIRAMRSVGWKVGKKFSHG